MRSWRGRNPRAEFVEAPTNVVVVENGTDTMLIDAGAGRHFMPSLGNLPQRLTEAGVAREAISKVVFTHAHADHLWGVIDEFDEADHFPNATYLVGSAEWDFWIRPETAERVPETFGGMAAGSRRRLKIIESKVQRRKAGEELAAGVTFIDPAGHTPGHMCVLLASEQERLMIGGGMRSTTPSSPSRNRRGAGAQTRSGQSSGDAPAPARHAGVRSHRLARVSHPLSWQRSYRTQDRRLSVCCRLTG